MVRFETPYNKRRFASHGNRGAEASADVAPAGKQTGARKWNSWWSRRSPGIATNDNEPACVGIDVGSKTIKLVALDSHGEIVYAIYHRHRSDVLSTLAEVLHDAVWRYGDRALPVAMTGSAGIALSKALGIPFVQEVVATTSAVRARFPEADCIIELGGEDAKITYLSGGVEQRMNATCAGGTGDFIDGIASMLGIRTRDISKLALGSQRTYPIASRCAVFAQTDVRPLINAGASSADIAQSALEAVVDQTLGGLACGRPIRGTVVFLGGPLEHIPALVYAFRRKMGLSAKTGIKPADAHLYTAMGAVIAAAEAPALMLSELESRAKAIGALEDDAAHLPPLFESADEIEAFRARHAGERLARTTLSKAQGPLYLGFDAGSTTMKYALVDATGALVAADYRTVDGDTFRTAQGLLEEVRLAVSAASRYGSEFEIARATVTGYGEDLLRSGLGFDSGVVETAAHLRAARQFRADVSFVLDIGGQDMKALWVRDGRIEDAVLNEACSSGCGAFVQSSAKSLLLTHDGFTREAFAAKKPIDLGAKCTVFMTSRVRHAQKTGAELGDIAAGIAYSIANNVMTRIIGKGHSLPLGDAVVVQGGTFKSDAVLRAFEKVLGVDAIRPDAAHLMGAYGAALVAMDEHGATISCKAEEAALPAEACVRDCLEAQAGAYRRRSRLLSLEELRGLAVKRSSARCSGCGNACALSIVDFGNGRRFVSGNRCERALEAVLGSRMRPNEGVPNVVALEQKLIARFGNVEAAGARGRVVVGLLNVLNVYENVPFWHTLIAKLGFSIVMPDDAAVHLRARAAETIPSESVCHPAKIAHMRYFSLVEQGASVVFAPTFERGARCPVACLYAQALADNLEASRLSMPQIAAIRPDSLVNRPRDVEALRTAVNSWLAGVHGPDADEGQAAGALVDAAEFACALDEALAAQHSFQESLENASNKAFSWLEGKADRRLAVLACRPYHADPALLHHIDEELVALGFAAVPQAALSSALRARRSKRALWKPSKHLMELVEFADENAQVEIVALRSFGCGYDAVSFDEAHDFAHAMHRPFTELKIDDIADTAHIRIRLRTLAYASRERFGPSGADASSGIVHGGTLREVRAAAVTPDLCSTAKAVVERALRHLDDMPELDELVVPNACVSCLTDALPFELMHVRARAPHIVQGESQPPALPSELGRLRKVGLVGNPLLVFNADLNDDVGNLVCQLGWQPVFPDPALLEVDDVRYIDQLARFRRQGVERVIYLQSFGCLKGHVQSRGALHELGRLFPDMPITVIDYDAESSALNRENRIRLALAG